MQFVYILIIALCGLTVTNSQKCLGDKEKGMISGIRTSLKQLEESLKKKSTGCPSGWKLFKDHCYFFSNDTKPWHEAERNCREIGGYLAQITDATENGWITNIVKGTGQSHWFGASDFTEGDWRWANDFSKVKFTAWNRSQPDNAKGNEDCAHMYSVFQFLWNDYPCSTNERYICERQLGGNCTPYSRVVKRRIGNK